MRSHKLSTHLGPPISIDSTDSEKEDILCYHPPSCMFNRDTYQMSPLLFESDTEDTSQSTEIKCYQDKTITPKLPTPNHQQIFDIVSTLHDLRNGISSQLDTSSQHNECCSETLLNSSNHKTIIETKVNTNNAYISPSPRVTRLKLLKSRILTRSARRLHKISEHSEYSESPGNSRKNRTKKDSSKERKRSSKEKVSTPSDKEKSDQMLIESIRMSRAKVILERLKFPFFQNPHQVKGTFIQPNIVPNIQVEDDADNDLDFLNRRLSSEVQMFTERPAVISISSESTVRNVSTPPRRSPDLFENFENSSVSNLCSQNSFDMPNGQILMLDAERRISESVMSTPNSQNDSTLVPSTFDLFDRNFVTPDVMVAGENLLVEEGEREQTFEITVNEVFDHVIRVADSEDAITPQNSIVGCKTVIEKTQPKRGATVKSDNVDDSIDLTKCASSQEVTPKKRPEIRGLLNKTLGACPSSSTLSRSKWLSKPRSDNRDGDVSTKTSQRCRRLDLWFDSDNENKNRKRRLPKFSLTSSEEEES